MKKYLKKLLKPDRVREIIEKDILKKKLTKEEQEFIDELYDDSKKEMEEKREF